MTRMLIAATFLCAILFSTRSVADPDCTDPDADETTRSLCEGIEASSELIEKSALLWQFASNDMQNTSACPPEQYLAAFERLQNAVIFRQDALCDVNLLVAGGMVGAGYSAERRYCHDAQRTIDELASMNLNTYACQVPSFGSLSTDTVTVSSGPAFNCAKASTDEEQEICNSQHLSLLDRYMSGLYKLAVKEYPESAARIKADQKKWLERRGGYLLESYEWRIRQLQSEFERKPDSY